MRLLRASLVWPLGAFAGQGLLFIVRRGSRGHVCGAPLTQVAILQTIAWEKDTGHKFDAARQTDMPGNSRGCTGYAACAFAAAMGLDTDDVKIAVGDPSKK